MAVLLRVWREVERVLLRVLVSFLFCLGSYCRSGEMGGKQRASGWRGRGEGMGVTNKLFVRTSLLGRPLVS